MTTEESEFFKGPYASLWRRHAQKTKALCAELVDLFPPLEGGIRIGLGADTDKWIKVPPHEKNEADIEVFADYKLVCHIEVTGSDKVRVPPADIWIRPGKIDLAVEREDEGQPYWFYLVYPNKIWTLQASDAAPYRNKVKHVSPYGKPERYVVIPSTAAKPKKALFDWIAGRLKVDPRAQSEVTKQLDLWA